MSQLLGRHKSIADLWQSEAELAAERERVDKILRNREDTANAFAMAELSRLRCPGDLIEWGKRHNIPEFAQLTWQSGFTAGFRSAFSILERIKEAAQDADK